MGIFRGPQLVTDGLELVVDAVDERSYTSGSSVLTNLVGDGGCTLQGVYSESIVDDVSGIRLDNTGANESGLQSTSITNITTVSLWYYVHSIPSTRYLLDMRTGGSSGYIYSGGPGTNWNTGLLYRNGIYIGTPTWANIEPYINNWINVTVIANIPATDDINIFQRYTSTEGYDVTFSSVHIYNRVLTPEEILQNFDTHKGRFGL